MKNLLYACSIVLLLCQSGIAQEPTLKSVDSNSDGKVTVAEFKAYAGQVIRGFDKMDDFIAKVDADGNGEISETEFAKRREIFGSMTSGDQEKAKEGPLVAGDMATDFELQGIDGKVKLFERFGDDGKPVVVVFSRANW